MGASQLKQTEINPDQPKSLYINKDEVDYLCKKWNIQDSRDLFAWGIKMLNDLSKLDENGWKLTLTKCEVDINNERSIHYVEGYRQVNFLMKWLAPTLESYPRLPLSETLEKVMKIENNN